MRRASSNASSSLRVASESACAKRSFAARSTSSARRLRSPSSALWRSALCPTSPRVDPSGLGELGGLLLCRRQQRRRQPRWRRRAASMPAALHRREGRPPSDGHRRGGRCWLARSRPGGRGSGARPHRRPPRGGTPPRLRPVRPVRRRPALPLRRVRPPRLPASRGVRACGVPRRCPGSRRARRARTPARLEGSDLREPGLRQRRQPLALLTSAGDRGLALITGRRGGGELAVHPISESFRFLEVTICPFPGFQRRLVLDGRLLVKPFGGCGQRPGRALGTLLRVALRDVTDLRRVGLRRRQQALALLERLVQQLSPEGLVTGVDRVRPSVGQPTAVQPSVQAPRATRQPARSGRWTGGRGPDEEPGRGPDEDHPRLPVAEDGERLVEGDEVAAVLAMRARHRRRSGLACRARARCGERPAPPPARGPSGRRRG